MVSGLKLRFEPAHARKVLGSSPFSDLSARTSPIANQASRYSGATPWLVTSSRVVVPSVLHSKGFTAERGSRLCPFR